LIGSSAFMRLSNRANPWSAEGCVFRAK
jgi:hypothetical protein